MLCLVVKCLYLGMFLVNGLSALVRFYSGATRSFLSLALSKRFIDAPGDLDYPLDVEITGNRPVTVRVSMVHRGCILEIFGVRYPIDLVLIPFF